MDYPLNLPISAAAVSMNDGEFSPFYDIVWSIKYEVLNTIIGENLDYGLCFFLRDSNAELRNNNSYGGGRGIDLGYSGTPGIVPGLPSAEGMNGGVIGIGLDTHGLFAASSDWPNTVRVDDEPTRSGLDITLPNSITVRGSQLDNYRFLDLHRQILEFSLLSEGIKVIRARLGNFGNTIYLDYREDGKTDFVNILTHDISSISALDGSEMVPGDGNRLTPGVSFSKPLTSADSPMWIKVHSFHVEGRQDAPDITVKYPTELTPIIDSVGFTGQTYDRRPDQEIIAVPPVDVIKMVNPED